MLEKGSVKLPVGSKGMLFEKMSSFIRNRNCKNWLMLLMFSPFLRKNTPQISSNTLFLGTFNTKYAASMLKINKIQK